jgi:uncharacterized glyoxalase superfamily protein PhnB
VIPNRSVPPASVIPELAYADVAEAADWLCAAFGFRQRLRIGDHRAQLVYGAGAVMVVGLGAAEAEPRQSAGSPPSGVASHSVLVRVDDVDHHHDQARRFGTRILRPPTDYPYGERQYSAEDPGGHHWTFSQSIADVDPASWGADSIDLG